MTQATANSSGLDYPTKKDFLAVADHHLVRKIQDPRSMAAIRLVYFVPPFVGVVVIFFVGLEQTRERANHPHPFRLVFVDCQASPQQPGSRCCILLHGFFWE
jgi:hypothetical protein